MRWTLGVTTKRRVILKTISIYLSLLGLVYAFLLTLLSVVDVPSNFGALRIPLFCVLFGGLGGVTYTLRAVYLNACVFKRWDDEWKPWYYIRPLVSLIMGGISYVFLQAGLLVLDTETSSTSSSLGFYALAYIAGLNVDKFIAKLEQLAESAWGIEKSRAGKESDKNGQ